MGYLCIEIRKGVSSVYLVRFVQMVHKCKDRDCDGLGPCPSEPDIEGSLSLPERSFELKSAVDQTYGKESMVIIEIAVSCRHIDDRGHLGTITGRKTALIEVKISDHIGIEGREQSCKMTDLVDGNSVEEKKVIASVTAMNIETGKKLGS